MLLAVSLIDFQIHGNLCTIFINIIYFILLITTSYSKGFLRDQYAEGPWWPCLQCQMGWASLRFHWLWGEWKTQLYAISRWAALNTRWFRGQRADFLICNLCVWGISFSYSKFNWIHFPFNLIHFSDSYFSETYFIDFFFFCWFEVYLKKLFFFFFF